MNIVVKIARQRNRKQNRSQAMKNKKYTLTIRRKNCREIIIREIFEGTKLGAERRLADLWNANAAFDGQRRFRATLADYSTRRISDTIE
jgi:uncharacterized protein YjiS (DUF1127 family)